MNTYKKRRIFIMIFAALLFVSIIIINSSNLQIKSKNQTISISKLSSKLAVNEVNSIPIKGRAPKTNYSRDEFGSGWAKKGGCDTRNIILNRDLIDVLIDDNCNVISGILTDPYTGKTINFRRGSKTSDTIQIDHVVPLSDAWQKGAQQFTPEKRIEFANDPLELLAVSSGSNMQKSDSDAATWLPSNKQFRCQYVARQIAVKIKYNLWMTKSEQEAIVSVLNKCPGQLLPSP